MKKILITFILITVVLGLYSEENLLWCKKILFNEPTKHIIQKGDYFSKLSKEYYGTTKYWRELALINRAPNKDLVFPGEEIIIPNLEAIEKLNKSRSLTSVNEIVDNQKDWIARNNNVTTKPYAFKKEPVKPVTEHVEQVEESPVIQESAPVVEEPVTQADEDINAAISEPVQEKEESSSMLPIILTIAAIVLVVGAMSIYLYRRKKKYEMDQFEPSEEDSALITGDGEEDEEDEDENQYVGDFSRREKEEEVLVN